MIKLEESILYTYNFKFDYKEQREAVAKPMNYIDMSLPTRIWIDIEQLLGDKYVIIGYHAIEEMSVKGSTTGSVYFQRVREERTLPAFNQSA